MGTKLVEYILSFCSKLGINGYLVLYLIFSIIVYYNVKELKKWGEKDFVDKLLMINILIAGGFMIIFILLELFGFIQGFILSD